MKDITELMQKYRECSRNLWNTYFWPQAEAECDWDLRDCFEDINIRLFSSLVLWPLEYQCERLKPAYYLPYEPLRFIRIVPKDVCSININREIDSGYWDYPVNEVSASDIAMCFIHFFDYNAVGFRDFEYIRVVIESSKTNPELNGRHALVNPAYVKIFFDESAAS